MTSLFLILREWIMEMLVRISNFVELIWQSFLENRFEEKIDPALFNFYQK